MKKLNPLDLAEEKVSGKSLNKDIDLPNYVKEKNAERQQDCFLKIPSLQRGCANILQEDYKLFAYLVLEIVLILIFSIPI